MSHSDGYWVTYIYEINNGRWQRVTGKHAERSYPLFTRFTNRANRTAVTPKAGKHPTADDLSNVTPKNSGHLLSYKWGKTEESEDISLNVKGANGKLIVCTPVSWYSSFSVAIDAPEGRRIVSMSATQKTFRAMLDEVVKKKYEVSMFAQRGEGKSSPEMMWAVTK